jgi:predicted peptidase
MRANPAPIDDEGPQVDFRSRELIVHFLTANGELAEEGNRRLTIGKAHRVRLAVVRGAVLDDGDTTRRPHVLVEPPQQKKRPCVVMAPACDGKGNRWVNGGFRAGKGRAVERELMEALGEVVKEQPIDPARIYVTGQSMGGVGTWGLLAAHPRRFAAAAPVCGLWDPADAKKVVDVPIWAFHGANDTAVPVKGSREMVEALRKLGAEPKYTEYPNLSHGVWGEAYATEALWEWMFAQLRKEKSKD